jgi:transcriptional regulator with XRE-family HTH domain
MNLQDVLNKVCNGMSDNKTSQKLGISRVSFSNYRNGHKTPSDEILEKFIAESGLNPVDVYLAAYAEKIKNPIVAEAFRNQTPQPTYNYSYTS